MANAQKPDFVFRRNGRVHLNRRGASVFSTTGSRDVRINGSNAEYTIIRGSVKSTGYPLHSPISPSLPRPYVTVCHHISTGVYRTWTVIAEWLGKVILFLNARIEARILKGTAYMWCFPFRPIDDKEINWPSVCSIHFIFFFFFVFEISLRASGFKGFFSHNIRIPARVLMSP